MNRKSGRWAAALLALCLVAICIAVPAGRSFADGGVLEMTAEKTEAKQGEIVPVSVVLNSGSSDVPLGDGTVFTIDFDTNILKFTDNGGYTHPGSIFWGTGDVGSAIFREVFKFEAVGQGDTDVTVKSVKLMNTNGEEIPCTVTTQSIHIHIEGVAETPATQPAATDAPATQPAEPGPTFSGDDLTPADLVSLDVTPVPIVFEPNVTDYTVNVATDVTRIGVNAVTADAAATYVVEGYDQLAIGENIVTVRVTGSDGSVKDYVLHVIRAAEETQPSTQAESTAAGDQVRGFTMTVDASEWYITTIPKGTAIPAGFKKTTLAVEGYSVPCYRSTANPDLYLTYAGENGADPALAYYRQSDGSLFPFVDIGSVKSGDVVLPMWVVIAAAVVILALVIALIVAATRGGRRHPAVPAGPNPPKNPPVSRGQAAGKPVRREAPARAPRAEEKPAPAPAEEASLYEDTPDPLPETKTERPSARREFDVFRPLYGAAPAVPDDDFEEDEFDDEDDEEELFGSGRQAYSAADQGRKDRSAGGKETSFVAPAAPRLNVEDLGASSAGVPEVDLSAIEKGLEREVSRMGAAEAPAAARPSRPAKPAVLTHRLNEATTRIDTDTVKENRG